MTNGNPVPKILISYASMIILNNAYAIVRTWLHQPLWGGSDAPGPEGCVPKGCESLSSPPETASLVMVGDGSGLQQSTAPQADGSSAAKVKGDHVEYKYPLPEKPPFATEIKETLSTAAPPDLSNQGKPCGRKSHASKAIAQELGDASDEETNADESKTARKGKPATKAKSKTAKGKGRGKATPNRMAKPTPKAKAKASPRGNKSKPSKSRTGRKETKADDEPKTKKARTARAIRMAATDDSAMSAMSTGGASRMGSSDIPNDAQPAPSHVSLNNVYSNTYRKYLASKPDDKEGARTVAKKATALFREHGMVRPVWTGTFQKKKGN